MRLRDEAALRGSGHWLGASCLAAYRDEGFVLAGQIVGDALVVSGIGGKVEPGETFREAMLREFAEETGVTPRTHAVAEAECLGDADEARDVLVPGAAAVVARRPAQHPSGGLLVIGVFLGHVDQPPAAVEKVEHFPVVSPEVWRDGPTDDLSRVSVLVDGEPVPARDVLPRDVTRIDAMDTARAVLARPDLLDRWWSDLRAGRG